MVRSHRLVSLLVLVAIGVGRRIQKGSEMLPTLNAKSLQGNILQTLQKTTGKKHRLNSRNQDKFEGV
jgi:hypothetical protein